MIVYGCSSGKPPAWPWQNYIFKCQRVQPCAPASAPDLIVHALLLLIVQLIYTGQHNTCR